MSFVYFRYFLPQLKVKYPFVLAASLDLWYNHILSKVLSVSPITFIITAKTYIVLTCFAQMEKIMKIIISPAKKMNINSDLVLSVSEPILFEHTKRLYSALKEMEADALQKLWCCNEKIAAQNYERLHSLEPDNAITPALLSYEGIQYQYMAPNVFTDRQWNYANEKLRILSGLYGILRPLDRVIPYRLEMQAKLSTDNYKNLYEFWQDRICQKLFEEDTVILNLASKEYSRVIEKYLTPEISYITCVFGEYQDGKIKVKGTQAKMARGEMVRWLSENEVTDPKQIMTFTGLGYRYCEAESKPDTIVFLK